MLYTAMPLERIYANLIEAETNQRYNKKEKDETNYEFQEVMLPHGRVVTRRDGENFVVQRINSTDMGDYLNEEYSPGNIVK